MSKQFIDPRKIKLDDCPVFILSDDIRGFFGWGIKFRTNSNYSHAMIMIRPRYVCTQGWLFREIPLEKYMKPFIRLKFWRCKDMTFDESKYMRKVLEEKLALPWWKRLYDVLGVAGQLIGLRALNIPWLNYCSEGLVKIISRIIPDMQKRPSPKDINETFKHNERMEVMGYWWWD